MVLFLLIIIFTLIIHIVLEQRVRHSYQPNRSCWLRSPQHVGKFVHVDCYSSVCSLLFSPVHSKEVKGSSDRHRCDPGGVEEAAVAKHI